MVFGRHVFRVALCLVAALLCSVQSAAKPRTQSDLKYVEFTTAGADEKKPLPLVIALHGYGDHPKNFARMWYDFPGPARFIVYQAPKQKGRGFSWFTVRRPLTLSQHSVNNEIQAAANLIVRQTRRMMKMRPTQGKPIVTGFSQGGILSLTIAIMHGGVFAAAVPLAGMLPTRIKVGPSRPAPITAFHGEQDDIVPLVGLERSIQRIRKSGGSVKKKSYPGVRHWISRPMKAEIYEAIQSYIDTQAK